MQCSGSKFSINIDKNGRFIVELPIKPCIDKLGDSKYLAVSRLQSMERKFQRNESLKSDYKNFMSEYLHLNHMKPVNDNNHQADKINYYLPHHAVTKNDSLPTKLRVDFDASAKSTTGQSLNDCLYADPTIQQDLFSLLARFRTYKYALTSDIAKMYRQVLGKPSQLSLQRIIWRQDASEPFQSYELTTLTYGTKTAPYLAVKTLQTLGRHRKFKLSRRIISYKERFLRGSQHRC